MLVNILGIDHSVLFDQVPVSGTVCRHWAAQDAATLNAAAEKISAHGANPWVFAADARHFHQFAGAEDLAAILAMTAPERAAMLGEWASEDFDAFSFEPHRQVRNEEEAMQIASVAALVAR
jgi:hypothetical protein